MSNKEADKGKNKGNSRKKKGGSGIRIAAGLVLIAAAVMLLVLLVQRSYCIEAFVAGNSPGIKVYMLESDLEQNAEENAADGNKLVEAGTIVRGTRVYRYMQTLEQDGETYCMIRSAEAVEETIDGGSDAENGEGGSSEAATDIEVGGDMTGPALYIKESDLVEEYADCVTETEVYVRTPATIYANEEGPEIASFAPKGTCLKVVGFDALLDNGYINKYKVAYEEKEGEKGEGYVYGKYMVSTEEEALAVYNEHGEHDKAKKDVFAYNLYGGKAENLDYYPYERPVIEGKELCRDARAMYINTYAAIHPDQYIKLIKDTDCNAVVIDIKDGPLTYKSPVAKEYSPTSYKKAYASLEDMRAGVKAYKDTGVYLIGRIVVFNDKNYSKDHPEDCIKYNGKTSWPSGYSRGVWEYNVKLALEAIEEFGFDEIQFDYVRFPESTFEMSKSGKANFRNKYGEEKGQAIQNFIFYSADQIHEAGAYFSVDVFGESCYGYMTAYGQYWPGISNIVDAISAMPYTDHTGGEGAWKNPYKTMKNWGKRAKKMQDYLQEPAVARTWITGYNTPYWGPTENYGEKELRDQMKGLEDAGLKGGFIPWNVLSDLGKYKQYKGVWNK